MTTAYQPADTDDELEGAVICAFLWATPAARNHAVRAVHPSHFRHGRNRTVWEHAARLHADGHTVDSVAVVDSLDRAGHLDDAGGMLRVTDINSLAHVSGAHLDDYAARLADRARHRHAVAAVRDLDAQLHAVDVDVDQVIHRGVADILHAGRRPQSVTVDSVELAAAADDLWEHGVHRGWESGWSDLDRLYRPTRRQLTVVTGVPAAGKSAWLNAYLTRLAHRHGHRYLIYAPEQTATPASGRQSPPVAGHVRLLTVLHGGSSMSPDVRRQAQEWVLDRFAWLDHQHARTLDDILSAARVAHDTRPVDGLLIDPWNWIDDDRPRHMTETEHIGRQLNDIVRFADELNVHVWVVAHPRKVEQLRDGTYAVPRPYDISGSQNWFNKPWFCLSLWRDHLADGSDPDHDPHVLTIHVQKVRVDEQGGYGSCDLRMRADTRRYDLLAKTPL